MAKIKQKAAAFVTAFAVAFGAAAVLPENVFTADAAVSVSGTTLTLSGSVTGGDLGEYFGDTSVKKIVANSGTSINDPNYLFEYMEGVEEIDLSNATFNLSEGVLSGMFYQCPKLKKVTLPKAGPGKATQMVGMFEGCTALETVNFNGLDTSSVTDMSNMFADCKSLKTIDISSFSLKGFALDWYNENSLAWMFHNCQSLQTVTLGSLDTTYVKDMSEMFYGCSSLTTIYASASFNTTGLRYGGGENMFYACNSLRGGNGTTYSSARIADSSYARIDAAGTPGYFTKSGSSTNPTPTPTAPGNVTGLTVKSTTTNSITLGWTKVSDATGYVIEKKVGSDWEKVATISNGSTVSYTVSGLANAGKTYTFRIRAYKTTNNTTLYSDYKSISGTTQLSDVTGLAVKSTTSTSITLGWTKNSSADGYIIEQKVGSSWQRVAKIASNATVTYTVPNLSASTTYNFRMRTYKNVDGTAMYGNYVTVNGTTGKAASVSKVTGLAVKARTTNSITFGWTKNTSAAGYIIEKKVGSNWERVAKIASNATTSYAVTGIAYAGKTYTFRIKAYNNVNGTAVYSDYTEIEASTTPGEVKGLTAKSNAVKAVTLSWTKDSYTAGYIIEKKVGSNWERVTKIATNATTSYTVTGLANSNKSYTFRIKTYKNDNGEVIYGEPVSVSATTK